MDNPIIPSLPTVEVNSSLSATGLTELTRTVEILEEDLPTLQQTTDAMAASLNLLQSRSDQLKSVTESLTGEQNIQGQQISDLQTVADNLTTTTAAIASTVDSLVAAQPKVFKASATVQLVLGATTTLSHGWQDFNPSASVVVFSYSIINQEAENSYEVGDALTVVENFTATATESELIVHSLNRGIYVYDRDKRRTRKIKANKWELLIKAVAYVS